MNLQNKKVLYIDLPSQTAEVKSHPDISKYIGGVGLAAKLLLDLVVEDALAFSIGPLNGFFPFASKTAVLYKEKGKVRQVYLGGVLSTRLRFSGLDALVLVGKAKEPFIIDIMDEVVTFRPSDTDIGDIGLPGKRSVLEVTGNNIDLDGHVDNSQNSLYKILITKKLKALVVTGSKVFEIKDKERYPEIYNSILTRVKEIEVLDGENKSCAECPVQCGHPLLGEKDGDILIHSVVACTFLQPIFADTSTVFSCLNVLGYDYTHEDIENLPKLVYDVLNKLED